MSAFVMALLHITDPRRYADLYARHMQATLDPFGGRYLTSATDFGVKEGICDDFEKVVLLEFPDRAQAHAWYESEAYAPLLAVRRQTAETFLAIFEQLDPPPQLPRRR